MRSFAILIFLFFLPSIPALSEIRTLNLFYTHTGEHATIVFKRNGIYDQDGLRTLNYFLRDWRRNQVTRIDPTLFDLIWMVYQKVGATSPVHVVSAYRAPETNNMLRQRSRGVARHSQHIQGKALDFFIPGVDLNLIRLVGMKVQEGGVGFYPGENFIHLDVGSVRCWPQKMTRQQLLALFPDGKTLHIPSDGNPLPGYEQAKVELSKNNLNKENFHLTQIASIEKYTLNPRLSMIRRKSLPISTKSSGDSVPLFSPILKSGKEEIEDAIITPLVITNLMPPTRKPNIFSIEKPVIILSTAQPPTRPSFSSSPSLAIASNIKPSTKLRLSPAEAISSLTSKEIASSPLPIEETLLAYASHMPPTKSKEPLHQSSIRKLQRVSTLHSIKPVKNTHEESRDNKVSPLISTSSLKEIQNFQEESPANSKSNEIERLAFIFHPDVYSLSAKFTKNSSTQ